MSLASHYASVLSAGVDPEKTLAYMKARGHLSLMRQVVRIMERKPIGTGAAVVTVAKQSDAKTLAKEIGDAFSALDAKAEGARVVVDERAVGGFAVRAGARIIDRTFRTALVGFYKNAVGSN